MHNNPEPGGIAATPPIIHVVGQKDTGKTGLIEMLIPTLSRLGTRTAVLKHDANRHFHWETPGTDTHRFTASGAPVVSIMSGTTLALHAPDGLDISLADLAPLLSAGCDLLLVEGFKRFEGRKIEVFRQGVSTKVLCGENELIATFGDPVFRTEAPHFKPFRAGELAALIIEEISGRQD